MYTSSTYYVNKKTTKQITSVKCQLPNSYQVLVRHNVTRLFLFFDTHKEKINSKTFNMFLNLRLFILISMVVCLSLDTASGTICKCPNNN